MPLVFGFNFRVEVGAIDCEGQMHVAAIRRCLRLWKRYEYAKSLLAFTMATLTVPWVASYGVSLKLANNSRNTYAPLRLRSLQENLKRTSNKKSLTRKNTKTATEKCLPPDLSLIHIS